MKRRRTKPYTQRGIRRLRCCFRGCRRRGYASWQACADGRVFRALCWQHDVELNSLVLTWIGDPDRARKIAKYSAAVIKRVRELGYRT